MRAFETLMARAEYACAGRFTLADISIGYALMLAGVIGFGDEVPDSLRSYLNRLAARPAFLRAKRAQSEEAPTLGTGRSA
jgi:glutathione S-transferase